MRSTFVSKTRFLLVVCMGLALAVVLAGCSSQSDDSSADEDQAARQYMSAVCQMSDDISEELEGFNEAVASDNVWAVRSAADGIMEKSNELASYDAPDEYADIQQDYADGCNSLNEALSDYLALYDEVESPDGNFDFSTYDDRLADIQGVYDDAIAKLEDADQKAAELYAE